MNEILRDISVFSVAAVLIIWLLKKLGQRLIDRDLKKYELELNLSLATHKHELELLSQKSFRLHDKRLEKIQEIYSLLSDFQNVLNQMIGWKIVTGMSDDDIKKNKLDEINKAYELSGELSNVYQRNKLFFTNETCQLMDELLIEFRGNLYDLSIEYQWMNIPFDLKLNSFNQAKESIKNKIPVLKEKLETNFRTILGV